MKVKVLQIVWHNKEPIFSLDFDASGTLATAGADSEIKVNASRSSILRLDAYVGCFSCFNCIDIRVGVS